MDVSPSVSSSLRARTGLLLVSACALLWGTTGVAVSIVHERSGMSAVTIGFWRVVIATAAVALLLGRRRIGSAVRAVRRHPLRLLVCGVGFGAYQVLYFVGVQDVGVSVSTLVSLGVAPVALTAGAAIGRRRLPDPRSAAVLSCALAGLALVSVPSGTGADASHPVLGVLASIGSGLGYAGITALSGRMSAENPLALTGITSAIAVVTVFPFALAVGLFVPHDAIAIGWLGYIGLVPTVAAYWLFYRGMQTTAPEVAGILSLLEPVAAAAVAALVLHERLGLLAGLGALLMLAAVAALYARAPVPELGELPPP